MRRESFLGRRNRFAAALEPQRRTEAFGLTRLIGFGARRTAAGGGGAAFTYDAADFSGDLLRRTSLLTGETDTKTGILSVWLLQDAFVGGIADFVFQCFSASGSADALDFYISNPGGGNVKWGVQAYKDTLGGLTMDGIMSSAVSLGTWHHVLLAWDLAAATFQGYVDGSANWTAGPSTVLTANNNIKFSTAANTYVGGGNDGASEAAGYDGGIAELYFAGGQYLDISNSANRAKFRDAGGHPVSLGTDGSLPTGTKPWLYEHLDLAESANNFATNRTSNGDLTVALGALATRGTRP